MKKRKKYNNQTKCYKIDLFDKGGYLCSTYQSKNCKEAVEKYLKKHPNAKNVFARFDYY